MGWKAKLLGSGLALNPFAKTRRRRRAVIYVIAIVVAILGYTLAYQWGMQTYEDEQKGFIESMQIVVQTLTNTGYGEDAPWTSVEMNLLLIAMQFSGVLLIFMTLPLFIVPWIENTLTTDAPKQIRGMEDHIIICGYTSPVDTLIDELESRGEGYVLIEPDEEAALDLYDDGIPVINGDPESIETLEDAGIADAKVLVANASDEQNASIVLSAKEVRPDVRVISLVENPSKATYIKYAGADDILSPRFLLGRSLADKVTTAVTTELGDTVEIGEDFEVIELPVEANSDLAGEKLYSSRISDITGVSVIGAWMKGEFVSPPSPNTYINENTVLIVAGDQDSLKQLRDMAQSEGRDITRGKVVVAGYGDVGFAIDKILGSADIDSTIIDVERKRGVDIVGDAKSKEVLQRAGIGSAKAFIITLPEDTDTIFATLVARELNPDLEILVRANKSENIGKMHRSGADYVLGLSTVTGRMLALNILEEEVMSPGKKIKIIRTEAPGLEGKTLRDADVRSTGCSVIAVERDGTVITSITSSFKVKEGDSVIVAGIDRDINDFTAEFGE